MLGIALALAASIAWGSSDFLGGLNTRRLPLLLVMVVSQGAGFLLLALVVAVHHVSPPPPLFILPAAVAGLAATVGLGCLYRALAVGVMSIVAPITATSAAIPVLVGLLLGERPGALQILGILVALTGLVLAVREPSDGTRSADPTTRGVGLAVLATLAFGVFFVALDASRGDIWWVMLVQRGTSTALFVLLAVVVGITVVPGRRDSGVLVLVGVLDAAASTLFALASRVGMLSVVSVAASLYPVATILLAQIVLRERIARSQQVGIGLALIGIAGIAAA